MKASIIITSYNYEKFVVECVMSVAKQTYKNIEIIFVDDGSIDGTIALINKLELEQLKIVEKSNGGQLSAFNAALPYITGDIVFFIDADDVYDADYIEKIIEFYQDCSDADFIYSGLSYFGASEESNLFKNTKNHGFSLCKTYFLRHWVGAPTSAISMRKDILNKILPLDIELDWKVRADDCLVWGSSLVGAKKYYFGGAEIKYRIHNANNFFGRKFNADYFFKRELAINRMFNMILNKNHTTLSLDLIIREFLSQPERNAGVLIDYMKIVFMLNISFLLKLATVLGLLKHYLKRINEG